MTAHAMKGDCERCLEAGMDGYVAKPVQAKDLDQAIKSFMMGRIGRCLIRMKGHFFSGWRGALSAWLWLP